MRVLVGCAGGGSRWNLHLGIPKHFAPVEGETLIGRTVRQLNAVGVTPLLVAHSSTRLGGMYELDGAETVYVSADHAVSTDKYLCSRHLWSPVGRTIQLWGDVWYSDEALREILGWDAGEWRLFGRLTGSRVTGCGWAEPFALVFHPGEYDLITHHLDVVTELWRDGVIDRCTTWEWYRSMRGLTGPAVRRSTPQDDLGHLTVVDDWTDDFDLPSDYQRWTARRADDH